MSKRPQVIDSNTAWLSKIEERLRGIQSILYNGGGSGSSVVPIQFTIGDGNPGTPANGSTIYANAVLNGKTISVHKNGVGYLTEGADYDLYAGGGIELLGGATFDTGVTYLIWIL